MTESDRTFIRFIDMVRHTATRWPASMLHPSIRRAAARDANLEWDAERHTYRFRHQHRVPATDGDGDRVVKAPKAGLGVRRLGSG